jgi:hypothetical protein
VNDNVSPESQNYIDRMAHIDKVMDVLRGDETPEGLAVLRTQLAQAGEFLGDQKMLDLAASGSKDEMINTIHQFLLWQAGNVMLRDEG